jgi:hypothetical protein
MGKRFHVWSWQEKGGWKDLGAEGFDFGRAQLKADRLGNVLGGAFVVAVEGDDPNSWLISSELSSDADAGSFADAHKEAIAYKGAWSADVCWDQANGGYKVVYLTREDFYPRLPMA